MRFEQGFLIVQKGLGYEELTVGSTAIGLQNIPTRPARRILLQIRDGDVRWIAAEGDAPTSTRGIKLSAGDFFVYDGDPEDLLFIQDAGSALQPTIGVHYFGA